MSNPDLTLIKKERERTMIKFSTPEALTEEQAREAQMNLSYHPSGYGFYSYQSTALGTTWQCGASCD
jgi:hypothetical protein